MDTRKDKMNAIVTGAFFIMATVFAIIGLKLYDPILNHPDYLVQGARNSPQIITGAVFELLLVCAAVGTGIMLFPYLKKFNLNLALGYLCFRTLESVFIMVGIVSVLALLTLSHSYTNATTPDTGAFLAAGVALKAIHDWTFTLGPLFMLGINTFIYSSVFFKSRLVPRNLAALGVLGAVLVFVLSILVMFGILTQLSVWGVLLALPIALYEMILAVWLIIKGFNLANLGPKTGQSTT